MTKNTTTRDEARENVFSGHEDTPSGVVVLDIRSAYPQPCCSPSAGFFPAGEDDLDPDVPIPYTLTDLAIATLRLGETKTE